MCKEYDMQAGTEKLLRYFSIVFVALLVAAGLMLAGCSASPIANNVTTSATTTAMPVSITDAPSDRC